MIKDSLTESEFRSHPIETFEKLRYFLKFAVAGNSTYKFDTILNNNFANNSSAFRPPGYNALLNHAGTYGNHARTYGQQGYPY